MSILAEAIRAVQRNLSALALYIALTVGCSTLKLLCDTLYRETLQGISEKSVRIYDLGAGLAVAACFALAQTVAFARMGKEIDRPLWKISGAREALARFFPLWLVLNLLNLAVLRLWVRALEADPTSGLASALLLMLSLATMFQVPVGACLMFARCGHWSELPESLAPLARQFPKVLIFLFLNFVQLVLALDHIQRIAANPASRLILWLSPALDVFLAYCDCLVFAGIWLICMITTKDIDVDF